jgi:hypothetical protein
MNAKPAFPGTTPREAGFLLTFLALGITADQAMVIFLPVCDIYHLPLSPLSW